MEVELSKHSAGKGKKGRKTGAIVGAVIALLAVVGIVLILVLPTLKELNSPPPKEVSAGSRPLVITIKKGWTADDIGQELANKKVVENGTLFRLYIRYNDLGGKLRPGEYEMRQGMTYSEAAAVLIKGPPERYITITIPEGYTIDQEAALLQKQLKIDPERFKSLAKNGAATFGAEYPFLKANQKTATLEGYLFPDTYLFKRKATAEDVIRTQLTQFGVVLKRLNVEGSGKNSHDIVTIASLIEREARVAEERPIIASVIYNRLNKNMLLQIDATVQYALPHWKQELSYKDLEIDSPYNTYKHAGLPPGPIAAPGLSCMKAALNPASSDYLYYVVKDEAGHHFFTGDYNQFLKAKEKQP